MTTRLIEALLPKTLVWVRLTGYPTPQEAQTTSLTAHTSSTSTTSTRTPSSQDGWEIVQRHLQMLMHSLSLSSGYGGRGLEEDSLLLSTFRH